MKHNQPFIIQWISDHLKNKSLQSVAEEVSDEIVLTFPIRPESDRQFVLTDTANSTAINKKFFITAMCVCVLHPAAATGTEVTIATKTNNYGEFFLANLQYTTLVAARTDLFYTFPFPIPMSPNSTISQSAGTGITARTIIYGYTTE